MSLVPTCCGGAVWRAATCLNFFHSLLINTCTISRESLYSNHGHDEQHRRRSPPPLPRFTAVRLPDGSTGTVGGYDLDGTFEVHQGRRVDYWHSHQVTVVE